MHQALLKRKAQLDPTSKTEVKRTKYLNPLMLKPEAFDKILVAKDHELILVYPYLGQIYLMATGLIDLWPTRSLH